MGWSRLGSDIREGGSGVWMSVWVMIGNEYQSQECTVAGPQVASSLSSS